MEVNPLQRKIAAEDIAPERLAGNSRLTQDQKITEASRQFESILVKQILSDSQKTVIKSEFSDDSTPAGIYQDLVTKTLADNISKSGAFGLAKTFEQQLNRPAGVQVGAGGTAAMPAVSTVRTTAARPAYDAVHKSQSVPFIHHPVTFSVKQP
jgi:Rod binding domain-containing protein